MTTTRDERVPFATGTIASLLDETLCPVARMRLFSPGINSNNRLFVPDEVIGDKGCLACGNCVDACPVVSEAYRFVWVQNQRTSMSLEYMVGEECRRCYKCIGACPQVSKPVKEYAAAFRRGEKIVHLLTALLIVSLAGTGITLMHYTGFLPPLEITLLRWAHRLLGVGLLLMPLLYLILDSRHLLRFLKRAVHWEKTDGEWLKALVRHIKDSTHSPMPLRVQFNPGQKAWYLYIIVIIFPVLGITGILQWLGLDYRAFRPSSVSVIMLIHMIFALTTDILLFVHLYIKYLRNWAILVYEVVKSFITKRHLMYSLLSDGDTRSRMQGWGA
jgi:cytochrome b subunit of formate dehydrogenase